MNYNKINLNLDLKQDINVKSLRTSKRMWLEILQFIWIWFKPKNLPKPLLYQKCSVHSFDVYIKLIESIKNDQFKCKSSIHSNIASIRGKQDLINTLRQSIIRLNIHRNAFTADEYFLTISRFAERIYLHKESMIENKDMIKISTIINNFLKKDIANIRIIKSLLLCCYDIQSTMEINI